MIDVIYFTYPWAMDVPGGGERQMFAYREHLARRGIDVRLFDMWEPRLADASIFHCFSAMPGVVELCGYAKRKGLRLVVSPNLWVTRETKQEYAANTIWNLFELADAIIVNSVMELNRLSDVFGIAESKFHVVYNAAEADFLLSEDRSPFVQCFGIERPFVLNVANIEPRKNQLRFLEVLRRQRPDLDLVVIGGVRDQGYFEACRRVGGDHLRVVGPLPYASPLLRSALCGCEFFAMPSTLETPSIAAIEAAAIGARVLLTDQGSTTEYFGDSVTYVSPDSEESLAAGISAAIAAETERSVWVARHHYLWPKVIPALVSIYDAVS